MSAPATLPPPPPAVRRAENRVGRKLEPPPTYPSIFREFRDDQRPAVQLAIDALISSNRSVTVLRVREYLCGILPATDRPATIAAKPVPAVVETVQIVGPPDFDEAANMARVAEQVSAANTARLRKSEFRARVAWAESLIDAGADIEPERVYHFKDGHTEPLIDGWGYSPRCNRYESEDTWRFRLAELFAPTGECGG